MFRRSRSPEPLRDRSWSARARVSPRVSASVFLPVSPSVSPRVSGRERITHTAPADEVGLARAPDRVSVWPAEGGRYGIDAHYQGTAGRECAAWQQRRLAARGLRVTVQADDQGAFVRLGPLAHGAVRRALEGFIARPLAVPPVANSR